MNNKEDYTYGSLTRTVMIKQKYNTINAYEIINNLQQRIDKVIEILSEYKHYSSPTEEQIYENEDKVMQALSILKGENNE